MFPHDKLDWQISRLQKRLAEGDAARPGQPATGAVTDSRLELARAAISKARFHDGGEAWLNEALTQVRRVLHREPGHPTALVLGALSLVLLDRADHASAIETAERLVESIAGEDLGYEGAMMPLSVAIGVSMLEEGDTPEQVLTRADRAMYQVKSAA